jgi:hypothetical protein
VIGSTSGEVIVTSGGVRSTNTVIASVFMCSTSSGGTAGQPSWARLVWGRLAAEQIPFVCPAQHQAVDGCRGLRLWAGGESVQIDLGGAFRATGADQVRQLDPSDVAQAHGMRLDHGAHRQPIDEIGDVAPSPRRPRVGQHD